MSLEKNERIEKEKRRLSGIFTKIDPKSKKAIQSLIENAAFMAITLQDLQESMNNDGVISKYQNGENQKGVKKSAEVDIYNSLIKHYMAIMKQLLELLPKSEVAVAENIIQRFGERREDV